MFYHFDVTVLKLIKFPVSKKKLLLICMLEDYNGN